MMVIFVFFFLFYVKALREGRFLPTQIVTMINGVRQPPQELPPTKLPRFGKGGRADLENLYHIDEDIDDYRIQFQFQGGKYSTTFIPVVKQKQVLESVQFFFLYSEGEVLKVKCDPKYSGRRKEFTASEKLKDKKEKMRIKSLEKKLKKRMDMNEEKLKELEGKLEEKQARKEEREMAQKESQMKKKMRSKEGKINVRYVWKKKPGENANIGLSLVYSIMVFSSVFVIIMTGMYVVMTNPSFSKSL